MKILHLASFVGNIGDNASHAGFYKLLYERLGAFDLEKCEIREFYNNRHFFKRQFDDSFVRYANTFDLLVIGGGSFFDYWNQASATGTTVDIPLQLLKKLKVRLLCTSLSCQPGSENTESLEQLARSFLSALNNRPKTWLAVRNDGSLQSVAANLGECYAAKMSEILDSAFFYQPQLHEATLFPKPYIALNLAPDQLADFEGRNPSFLVSLFYDRIAQFIDYAYQQYGINTVLVPHILADLECVGQIITRMDDLSSRQALMVAPCVGGSVGAQSAYALYGASHAVIATRFHANVFGMTSGARLFGLAARSRIKSLHGSVGSNCFTEPNNVPQINSLWDIIEGKADDRGHRMVELYSRTEAFYDAVLGDFG